MILSKSLYLSDCPLLSLVVLLATSTQMDGSRADEAGQPINKASSSWMQDVGCRHFLCNDLFILESDLRMLPGEPYVLLPSVTVAAWVGAMGKEHNTISGVQRCLFLNISATEYPRQSSVLSPLPGQFVMTQSWYCLAHQNVSQEKIKQVDMPSTTALGWERVLRARTVDCTHGHAEDTLSAWETRQEMPSGTQQAMSYP